METHGHNCQGEFLNYTTRVESINVTLEAEQQQDGTDIKTTRQVSSSRTNKGHCHEKSERKVSKRMETFMFCFCFCFVKRNEGAARHADRYKSLKKMQSEETQSISAFSQVSHAAASSITNCGVMFSGCQQCPDVIEQLQHVANMKESANI